MDQIDASTDFEQLASRLQKLEYQERQLKTINEFAIELVSENSIDDIVWYIAKKVVARMGFLDCIVYLYDREEGVLVQKAAHGPKNPLKFDIKNPITINLGEGIVGSVAKTGIAEIVNDTRLDARYIIDDENRLSEIAVPIIFEDQLLGIIDSEHSSIGFYTEEHLTYLNTIAAITAPKIMHAKAMEQLANYRRGLEEEVNAKTIELQNTISKLKKSNLDLERFAYAASHDLQEPIRTIASYLQLIKKKETDISKDAQEFLDFAIDGAKRMKKLLEGLLLYSKLGKNGVLNELIDLDLVIEMICANLNARIKETNAQVHYKNLGFIRGNKTQIIQLFQNLFSNAFKFKKKEVSPIIKLSAIEKGNFLEIQIQDNGIGIEGTYHQKIFDLFCRLNTIDKYEGSGMGLALCKRIIENHSGNISLDSEIDKGTTFYISLPKLLP